MHLTKIITTKRVIKNKKKYIGFLIHQIPSYLTREHFEFNHLGYTFIKKSNIKKYQLLRFSKS